MISLSLHLSSRLPVISAWGGRKTWHRWDPQPQSSRLHAVVLGPCDCSGPQVQNALLHHIMPWRGGSRGNGDGEGRIPCFHSIAPPPSSEKPYKALSGQQSRFIENSSWCDTIKVPQMSMVSPSVCCVRVGLGKRWPLGFLSSLSPATSESARAYQRIYLPLQQHEWLALGWSQGRPNTR